MVFIVALRRVVFALSIAALVSVAVVYLFRDEDYRGQASLVAAVGTFGAVLSFRR